MASLFKDGNIDSSLYFGQIPWDQLFAAFNNPEIWKIFYEGAKQRQQQEIDEKRNTFFVDSYGGVTCRWGYENGVKV